jgi:hypothetical protein
MTTERSPRGARRLAWVAIVAGLLTTFGSGCRSAAPAPAMTSEHLAAATSHLARSLPGDLAALYRLRVPSSGGLRLSIATAADEGRVTISEPFGSALSLTVWSGVGSAEVFDLKEGCRFTTDDLSGVLGVGDLPLPQLVRLLGGRLPAIEGDRIEIQGDDRLRVSGSVWQGLVEIADDPFRVIGVEDLSGDRGGGWRIELRNHSSSVPGWLRVRGASRRWAELELVRLEWHQDAELPPVPELPPCAEGRRKPRGTPEPLQER